MNKYVCFDYEGNQMDEDDIQAYINLKIVDMRHQGLTDIQIYLELFDNYFFIERFFDTNFYLKLKKKYKYLLFKKLD